MAHHIYGIPVTLNAAHYVYCLALEKLLDGLPGKFHCAGVRLFTEQMLQLHRGKGAEIYWRDAFICPTEEAYLELIGRNSSGLFGMFVRLMQLFSEDRRDFSSLINLMGTYFQIRSDYCNLKSKTVTCSTLCHQLAFYVRNCFTTQINDRFSIFWQALVHKLLIPIVGVSFIGHHHPLYEKSLRVIKQKIN